MGPLAGIDLAAKIVEQTVSGRDQDHVPFVLVSVPGSIPDRTEFLDGRPVAHPAEGIVQTLQKLEAAGATVAGIACVTAHAPAILNRVVADLQRDGLRIRLLSLVTELVSFIRDRYPKVGRVAALSTNGTYRHEVLFSALGAAGFQVIRHDPDTQEKLVHDAVYRPVHGIKAQSKPVSAIAKNQVALACDRVVDQGAELVVLGCTELPLAVEGQTLRGAPLVDPTLVLARALIRETFPERLRPLPSP